MKEFFFFLIYIIILFIFWFLIPFEHFDPYAKQLIFFLGIVGIWRYSWLSLNIIRSLIYRKIRFKKIRKAEEEAGSEIDPEHVFILITTFRIGTSVSVKVYRAAIQEAIECGYDVTIIASIVEMSEERLVRKIFLEMNPPERVKLVITRIKGTGKRDGLAVGFRVVANSPVNLYRSVVAVVDGDSILGKGVIRKSARLFGLNENLGALTTDEDAILEDNDFATNIYRKWYRLRFAQRNVSMSSLALSDRVLTLTGRMSMIRANIVGDREFVNTVQNDYIEHWRLGKFKFLTGDDKSSWYYVIKHGWDMWYVPDVVVYTIEEIPHPNWFIGSIMLMQRWFGNQYRTNERALKIPRKVLGWYAWYALWDQRFTMWTSPYGLFMAIFGAIHWGGYIFLTYLWWVMLSRLLMTFAYRTSRKDILPSWPFYLYYNQIIGSFVKIYIWNHLYKQSWTRQKTKLKAGSKFIAWYQRFSSNSMLLLELLIFLITVNFLVLNITFDDVWRYFNLF
ncbi:glycosyltransferase [Caminibacter sp.]